MSKQPRPAAVWPPPAISRTRVADGVTSYLRDLILSGQLRAGDHLRVEHLASQLDVSVTPIRESLLELLGEGFVSRAPRRGYVVAELTRDDISQVYTVLATLGGELAALASTKITAEELARIDDLQNQLEQANTRSDFDIMEGLNHGIHKTINKAAGARRIAWFVERASRYAPRWTWHSIDGWPDASGEDHRAVIDALRRRDPNQARAAMTTHMQHSSALLIGHLERHGFWEA